MENNASTAFGALIRGLLIGIAITLLGMLAISAAMMWLGLSDRLLHGLNQAVKLLAMLAGVCAAVPRGGRRGFLTGMALCMLYMILGYGLYLSLGGGGFQTVTMLGEILLGAAVGGAVGAVRANLPQRRRLKLA